ncbi:hypothetical protein PLESTF_000022300 [Pleodorina starrii]|nr:hypothetical protein PLESTF_000022300 [Pleodorina starrii]
MAADPAAAAAVALLAVNPLDLVAADPSPNALGAKGPSQNTAAAGMAAEPATTAAGAANPLALVDADWEKDPNNQALMARVDGAVARALDYHSQGPRQGPSAALQLGLLAPVGPPAASRLGLAAPRSVGRLRLKQYAVPPSNQLAQMEPVQEDAETPRTGPATATHRTWRVAAR